MTSGLEEGFLSIKDSLKVGVDPLTQPLNWALTCVLLGTSIGIAMARKYAVQG